MTALDNNGTAPLVVPAPIHHVTVFRNGALVVRRGTAAPGALEVRGLPLVYNSDSLRVRADRGVIRDLEETCTLESEPAPPPPSEEALRQVELDLRRLDDEAHSTAALLSLYEGVGPAASGKVRSRDMPDAGAWIALHEFAHRRREALDARRRQLEVDKRELSERRRRLQQADRGDREPPCFTRGVAFTLTSAGAEAESGFEVEYFVPAARWVPTYTLHLDGGHASLALAALVAQATGEDWDDAELELSAAQLSRESNLPELRSWRIGRAQPQPRPAFRPLPDDLEALFAGYDARARRATRKPPAAARRAVVEETADLEDTIELVLDEAEEPMAGGAATEVGFASSLSVDRVRAAPPAAAAPRAAPMKRLAARKKVSARPTAARPSRRPPAARPPEPQPVAPQPAAPLPPRLRYAYLRLIGPDQPHRGQLHPVDPLEHLWSLVEDHGTAHPRDLRRAVKALRQAAARLYKSPTPPGTSPLKGTSFHHVYQAAGRHGVPSDGGYHRVLVERTEAFASTELRTVPRGGDEVYRFCRLTTPAGVPYPTGPLHVYEDGEFRVTSRLAADGGGQPLELNLGVEPALRVIGRKVDVKQQEKGVVSLKSKVEHRVRIRLRSALAEEARVVVYDRLPTPDDNQKDLEVELVESSPRAVEDGRDPAGKKLDGGLHWELTVPPGATAEVSYRYEISLPASSEIVGGNRRE